MALHVRRCPNGHVYEFVTTIAHSDLCPECGLAGEKVWAPSADRVMTTFMDPGTERAVLNQKSHYESDEVSRKVLSGELELRENGPKHLRPRLPDHLRRYS